jgi:hypothetical protein
MNEPELSLPFSVLRRLRLRLSAAVDLYRVYDLHDHHAQPSAPCAGAQPASLLFGRDPDAVIAAPHASHKIYDFPHDTL